MSFFEELKRRNVFRVAIGYVITAWVKRESEVDRSKSIAPQTGRKMDRNIIIAMALAPASPERAFEEGDSYAIHIKRMNVYDPIRDRPRFQALLKKMNMWP